MPARLVNCDIIIPSLFHTQILRLIISHIFCYLSKMRVSTVVLDVRVIMSAQRPSPSFVPNVTARLSRDCVQDIILMYNCPMLLMFMCLVFEGLMSLGVKRAPPAGCKL